MPDDEESDPPAGGGDGAGDGEPDRAAGSQDVEPDADATAEDAAPETGADTENAEPEPDVAPDDAPASGSEGPGADEQYCSSCGEVIKREAEICPHCGVRQQPAPGATASGSKDRVTAGILAILLGWIGAHKFYLGDTGLGILYLCFFWTGIPAIVGLIEGILYLTKTDEEFQRRYVD